MTAVPSWPTSTRTSGGATSAQVSGVATPASSRRTSTWNPSTIDPVLRTDKVARAWPPGSTVSSVASSRTTGSVIDYLPPA